MPVRRVQQEDVRTDLSGETRVETKAEGGKFSHYNAATAATQGTEVKILSQEEVERPQKMGENPGPGSVSSSQLGAQLKMEVRSESSQTDISSVDLEDHSTQIKWSDEKGGFLRLY